MIVVGLTGGIGTGKSTVASLLLELGAAVIDSDQVARAVVKPGSVGLRQIVDAFGPEALASDGDLDRAAMRRRITSDASAKATLEAITHPLIHEAIAGWLAERREDGTRVAVVEAALMIETGSYRSFPNVWVVTTDRDTQRERVQHRDGISPDEAQAIIDSQLPLVDKEAVATCLIVNDADLATLRGRVATCWNALTRPAP